MYCPQYYTLKGGSIGQYFNRWDKLTSSKYNHNILFSIFRITEVRKNAIILRINANTQHWIHIGHSQGTSKILNMMDIVNMIIIETIAQAILAIMLYMTPFEWGWNRFNILLFTMPSISIFEMTTWLQYFVKWDL